MSAELTALFSLLLRSPDKRSPRGDREGPWLPGEATPGPQSSFRSGHHLSPSARPLVLCCPTGSSCVLSLLSESVGITEEPGPGHAGGARASLGAWPRPPSLTGLWLCPLKKRTRRGPDGPQLSQPRERQTALDQGGLTLGQRSSLSLCPRLSELLLFSYPFSIYSIDQRTNLFYRGRAPAGRVPGRRGAQRQRGRPAEAPSPRTLQRALGGPRMPGSPTGHGRQSPHAEPAAPGTQTHACALPFCT